MRVSHIAPAGTPPEAWATASASRHGLQPVWFWLALSTLAFAQPPLRLKVNPAAGEVAEPSIAGRVHRVIQFEQAPGTETLAALAEKGVRVLADVPDHALLVSLDLPGADLAGLGVRRVHRLRPEDKVSPLVQPAEGYFLVELHGDVARDAGRRLILNAGPAVDLHENPDLSPAHLMIHSGDPEGTLEALRGLAGLDEVAYIFPASPELIRGSFVTACAGALTANGSAGQIVSTYGDGWDGPGMNATTLGYVFSRVTSSLPSDIAKSEIIKAMNEWAKTIALTWQAGSASGAARAVNVLFASGSHGDGYPFDGPGRVLAHTFYPAPPNPEPIAGDMHLDDSEIWRTGANPDVFSVALHELGHALGLGHSDDPNAVMYPYYRLVSALSSADKAAILTLYAPAGSSGGPGAPTALTLTVNATVAVTDLGAIALSGTVRGGATVPAVSWVSSTGAAGAAQVSGDAWSTGAIALANGMNTITVTAASGSAHVSRTVTITRQEASTPNQPPDPNPADTAPPTLAVTYPGGTSAQTSSPSITIRGWASDSVGVARVTWQTSTGSSGVAAGTTQWSASVPLLVGYNTVTVRAFDAAGNSSWRTVVVVRR